VAASSALLFLLVLLRMTGLVNELRRAQEQRGHLLNRTVQAREEERMRLAGELHDGPIQRLAYRVVFSRPGDGVTVRVTFPTRVATPSPPVAGADGR
jgi:signal transduction histidine kinase